MDIPLCSLPASPSSSLLDHGHTPAANDIKNQDRHQTLELQEDEECDQGKRIKAQKIKTAISTISMTFSRWKRRILPAGWRSGVKACAVGAILVLFINLLLTIGVAARHGFPEGVGTVSQGSCDAVNRSNAVVHLFINLLSTILLLCCNYTMRCLSAPTRSMIDKRHNEYRSLDVGMPSLTNLRFVGPKNVALWGILLLSSIPLHLLYVLRWIMRYQPHD